jgi:glucosylceramidase
MKIKLYQTAKDTKDRISKTGELTLSPIFKTNTPMIVLNPSQTYQTHIGFGGAFTESAAYTLSLLPQKKQDEIIHAYFSKEGLSYNLGRTHIHSCDFALGNYTYVKENDKELKTFDISHEDKWVVPMIKKALAYEPNLKLLASPWSPPAWMKSNNNMNFGGTLLPEFYQPWANYYIKYFEEMKKRGIYFWALTVQNEPAAVQTWDSCIYTAEEERDFVKNYLGPTLEKSPFDLKLLGWDHNRDIIVERASTMLLDKDANKYLWGIASHWYVSEQFENLSIVHEMFPDKHLVFTEGCIEGGPKPHAWHTGERYARNIIGDLNNHLEGFIDWNLILNEEGGPNHVKNYCDAPILVDRNTMSIIYNSSYYYIGHFSKFIKPGAKRIHAQSNLPAKVYQTSYINPNQELILVVQNESDQKVDVTVVLNDQGQTLSLLPHSIVTCVIS